MSLETTSLGGRPRNRWQDEVRKDGRLAGEIGLWEGKGTQQRGMKETPASGKES